MFIKVYGCLISYRITSDSHYVQLSFFSYHQFHHRQWNISTPRVYVTGLSPSYVWTCTTLNVLVQHECPYWTKIFTDIQHHCIHTFSFLARSAGLSVHIERSLMSGPAFTRNVLAVSPMFCPRQSGNSVIQESRLGWPSESDCFNGKSSRD